MKSVSRMLAAALITVAAGAAHASLVTFEGHPDDFAAVQTSEGFTFSFSASGWGILTDGFADVGTPYTHNGTTRLMAAGGDHSVTMSRTGGGVFSLQGLDAAVFFPGFSGQIELLGHISGGGTVSTTLDVLDVFASYGGAAFNAFSSLNDIVFTEVGGSPDFRGSGGLSLDNLRVDEAGTTVPEPGALLLSCLALGMLGLVRRGAKRA